MTTRDVAVVIAVTATWGIAFVGIKEVLAISPALTTAGVRFDVPVFANTGYDNTEADKLSFRDEHNGAVQYNSGKLPDATFLWSPRLGFNWAASGNRNLQVRGGTGIFTAPPAYVWISNQIGNTGVLTGFLDQTNTTAFPWNPDPNKYKSTNVTGAPAAMEMLFVA